jgi:hypothetical protein
VTWGFKGFPVHVVNDELEKLERSSRLSRLSKWLSDHLRKMLGLEKRQRRHPERDIKPDQQATDPKYPDYRADEPWRREPEEIYWDLRHRFWWRNVMFPHVVAVVLGLLFFIVAAALNAAGVDHLHL